MESDEIASIATELGVSAQAVRAVLRLLSEHATVPFIARYRKEATSGLDEVQIRAIDERYTYLQELAERKATVLSSIEKQGKLTPDLREALARATTKSELEDLYLPFKPKRRTRGQIAREQGLGPFADQILAQPPEGDPHAEAVRFVAPDKGVPDMEAALQGAMDIIAERVAEEPELRAAVRKTFRTRGVVTCKVKKKALKDRQEPTKFEQYYDFREAVAAVPPHRVLAIRRGEQEGFLQSRIELDDARELIRRAEQHMGLSRRSPFSALLAQAVADGYRRLLASSVAAEILGEVRLKADAAAVNVFADNLRHLLLAAPLGERSVLGIDPGFRTGCKCAAVDATGALLEHATIYPTSGPNKATEAEQRLLSLIARRRPAAIAVGNGTAGRETEAFVRQLLREHKIEDIPVVSVNEAGASVYSASEIARREFPDLDLTVRGAISIARRLQDPLAELVKIDPKAIGVGQYQHDVSQAQLARKLDEVVESCVNHVGVELNTASAPLLSHVAGVGPAMAERIVSHRTMHGPFAARKELLKVSGLGPRTFEQAAGFLRIRNGNQPLDQSAVHPERYTLVQRMAKDLGSTVAELLGNDPLVDQIEPARYVDENAGLGEPTLHDILSELKKPGRDPRKHFEAAEFRADVQTLDDLEQGMQLQGIVTNVAAFGAFVDVGVHQDGLVHISELADRFVREPAEVVKVGDRITVRVLAVDKARKRISLTARSTPRPVPPPRDLPKAPSAGTGKTASKRAQPAPAAGKRFANQPFSALGHRSRKQ